VPPGSTSNHVPTTLSSSGNVLKAVTRDGQSGVGVWPPHILGAEASFVRIVPIVCLVVLTLSGAALAQPPGTPAAPAQVATPTDVQPGSINNEDVPYPFPVSYLSFVSYGQDVRMAYMDVPAAAGANGRTVVLLHGMNFAGFYWANVIDVLRKGGFRVVVTDQIGFGRSSKPIIPYNFHDMAQNTRRVLDHLGITKTTIVGHSMGGMLAARFAASYPDITERVVLYDPIGLTDARFERPYRSTDEVYKGMLAFSYQQAYATIKRYFPTPESWKPEYEKLVRLMYAWTLTGDWPRMAMVRTLLQQMIYTDPVVYDWAHIKAKTLVIGGEKDGPDFPRLAKHVADTIAGAQLYLVPNAGHVLHFETPDVFNRELLKFVQ
jgi:pimeloyl-ACP methyl ester carboxylesterase